ncbi:MAG TPA: SDR family NAD(P)-dependent oxidoreductase, partial [Actinomycetota bacterium]|nr:SDR family NAD(P)-dependent oxidoreductase [Actinomycetota bacterium]
MELSGSNAILTGASRGLGVYIADALALAGVNLALAARDQTGLDATADRVRTKGVKVATIPTDVGDEDSLRNLADQAEEQLGPIDILINNAGVEHYIDFHTADTKLIEKIMRVNILGPQVLTRFVLPGMVERKRGHIVNIASVAGKT